jgi:hypothetical protein
MSAYRPIPTIGGSELEELTAIRERELARSHTRRQMLQEAEDLKIWHDVQVSLSPWQMPAMFDLIEAAITARMEVIFSQAVQLLAEERDDRAALERIWRSI